MKLDSLWLKVNLSCEDYTQLLVILENKLEGLCGYVIESIGSIDIEFEESKRCPDSEYNWNGSQYPHLVMEVSYSQKQNDLPYLANNYIVDSDAS